MVCVQTGYVLLGSEFRFDGLEHERDRLFQGQIENDTSSGSVTATVPAFR
jgi:hypothetical protein